MRLAELQPKAWFPDYIPQPGVTFCSTCADIAKHESQSGLHGPDDPGGSDGGKRPNAGDPENPLKRTKLDESGTYNGPLLLVHTYTAVLYAYALTAIHAVYTVCIFMSKLCFTNLPYGAIPRLYSRLRLISPPLAG